MTVRMNKQDYFDDGHAKAMHQVSVYQAINCDETLPETGSWQNKAFAQGWNAAIKYKVDSHNEKKAVKAEKKVPGARAEHIRCLVRKARGLSYGDPRYDRYMAKAQHIAARSGLSQVIAEM